MGSDGTVFVDRMKEMTVYVRQFSGYARKFDDWRKEAVALGKALKAEDLSYVKEYYFTNGYDAPFKLLNRHNEIWFIKKA